MRKQKYIYIYEDGGVSISVSPRTPEEAKEDYDDLMLMGVMGYFPMNRAQKVAKDIMTLIQNETIRNNNKRKGK